MLNIGILGSGSMGTTHARAFNELAEVRVAAICSRSLENATKLAGVVGAAACTDPYSILDNPHIDAISNTLPTHLHEEYTVAALQRGKHVLLEKPMGLSLDSCDRMAHASALSGHTLMIAQVLRFWPEYIAVANLLQSRALGQPLSAAAMRLSARPRWGEWFTNPEWTGGAVLDLHIHDVDACNWLFGQPQFIYAQGHRGPNGGWDQVFTLLDYGTVKASAEASVMLPDEQPFVYGLRVLCENGSVSLDNRLQQNNRLLVYESGKQPYFLPYESSDAYSNQAAYFIDCILSGQSPHLGTPEQGRAAVAACLAARQSLETGQVISFER
jgi:UDP-N-acetylglucosamine 3-dehydrogenase